MKTLGLLFILGIFSSPAFAEDARPYAVIEPQADKVVTGGVKMYAHLVNRSDTKSVRVVVAFEKIVVQYTTKTKTLRSETKEYVLLPKQNIVLGPSSDWNYTVKEAEFQ